MRQLPYHNNLPGKIFQASPVWLLVAVSGLSFCFFLGFPFNNHNESFLWIVVLNKVSFWDVLTRQVINIESFRPLGMANSWLSYRISGNIYLQQLLNWAFAVSSFWILFNASKNKIFFALAAFLTASCFFSGYIYLFHLHGVFYGPLQLYVAVITVITVRNQELNGKTMAFTALLTLLASLYHTFALLVYCGFLAGYAIQAYRAGQHKYYPRLGLLLAATLLLAGLILQHKGMHTLREMADGLLVSYRLMEINGWFAAAAMLMVLLTVLPFLPELRWRVIAVVVLALAGLTCLYLHLPLLLLWVMTCLAATAWRHHWALAGIISATGILPVGSGSGSPTYVVFVLMVCTFITANEKAFYIPDSAFLRKAALGGLLLLALCLIALRMNKNVPLAASLAKPILSEKEKTFQLNDIISWKLNSRNYHSFGLMVYDPWTLPVHAENAVSRSNRPVTDQEYINTYIDFLSHDTPNSRKTPPLYITFGDKILKGKALVFAVNGKWNGRACVFR